MWWKLFALWLVLEVSYEIHVYLGNERMPWLINTIGIAFFLLLAGAVWGKAFKK